MIMDRIAILLDQKFDDSEFRIPYDHLHRSGYLVEVVGGEFGAVLVGIDGERVRVDRSFREIAPRHYDGVVIPGGWSPDELRADRDAVQFVRELAALDRPIGAIGRGTLMLIAADLAYARLVTGPPSIEAELLAAGGRWLARDIVVDGNVISARSEADLPAFTTAFLHQVAEGVPTRAEPVYPFEAMEPEHPGVR
jgi:protease I